MRRLAALVVMTACMAGVFFFPGRWAGPEGARLSLSFGFLMIAAYLAGDILSWAKLPRITGYILAGAAAGPWVSGLIPMDAVAGLKLLDNLALAFIALAAGGELDLSSLRARFRNLCFSVGFQAVGVFAGLFAVVALGRHWIDFLSGAPLPVVFSAAAAIGVLSIARSPSTVIAVISESRAKGVFSEAALSVTLVIDVLVIVFFACIVSAAQALVQPETPMDLFFLLTVGAELAGSAAAGVALGWAMAFYIRRIRTDIAVFILAVAFLATFLSGHLARFLDQIYAIQFHIEPMLMCMTAGFFIRNFTSVGSDFIERLDRISLPVYVLFFALIGASLNLSVLRQTWWLAAFLAGARGLFIWASAWASGRICRDPPVFCRMSGFSYIAQAGVSLSLAGILAVSFPDWGPAASVTIVAMISINQILGPITFKYALDRVGESRASRQPRAMRQS